MFGALTSRVPRRGSSRNSASAYSVMASRSFGYCVGHLGHGVGVGLVLFLARLDVEILDVADAQRVDERALLRRRLVLQADRLLRGGVREGRLLGRHRAVQVRAPRPAFAPVADGAVGIALPRFAERAHRVEAGERVHHLEALVEKRLRFLVRGGDGAVERAEAGGVERDRVFDVFRNFSGSIEVTLLSPARGGAGYETTKTETGEPAHASDHRGLHGRTP